MRQLKGESSIDNALGIYNDRVKALFDRISSEKVKRLQLDRMYNGLTLRQNNLKFKLLTHTIHHIFTAISSQFLHHIQADTLLMFS